MKRVALYARVSTEEQKMHGYSIGVQKDNLKAWAAKQRYKVVDIYADEGISARKPASKRPELQRLLNDVRTGKVDIVAFTKLDRWFRNVAEYYKVQEVLEAHGVAWQAIHEDYETATASGRLKVNIMLSVAQDEADRTSERLKTIFAAKRERGEVVTGNVALGIKVENKRYAPSEDAHIIQDVFQHFIATRNISAAQRMLLEKHNLYKAYCTVRRYLLNENYAKVGVVSQETFDAAAAILSDRAPRISKKNIYLFQGLLKCGECGYRMGGFHYNDKNINSYRCHHHSNDRVCPNHRTPNEKKIERYLLEHLLLKCDEYNIAISEKQRKKPDTAPIKKKLSKLKDLYLADLIDIEEYRRDYEALQAALEEAEKVPEPIDTGAIKAALEVYNALSREGKKEFWSRTLKSISAYQDGGFSFELSVFY